jgi:hypothetical protein
VTRAATATPVWVKLSIASVLVVVLGWWTLERVDRSGNEQRLSAIATQIAGRDVKVRCPGPFRRALAEDGVEGSVRFDAAGRPSDSTRLRKTSCEELDALAEGRRAKELACTERAGILCGRHGSELAIAVDVLTHESWHLRGVQDEARTECDALQTMAGTAMALGATKAQAQALARGQYAENYPRMPDSYRSEACVEGGPFDLHPYDPAFP